MKNVKKQILVGLSVAMIALFSFKLYDDKPVIHSIGDSTMCNFEESYLNKFGGPDYPIRGWMQMILNL